jgi:uncharacterized protein (DUF885 family)
MSHRLDKLIGGVLDSLWVASPATATLLGVHEHDDRLADFDPLVLESHRRSLSHSRQQLSSILRGRPALTRGQAIDARILDVLLQVESRSMEELRLPFRDPTVYLEEILFGVYSLVQRDFAPLDERARSLSSRLKEVPRCLRQARENLKRVEVVPAPWVEAALQLAEGSLSFLRQLERELPGRVGTAGPDLRVRLNGAMSDIEDYRRFIRERLAGSASGDFAVGRKFFEFLLREQHGLELDAEALHDLGMRLIASARSALSEAAHRIVPGRTWWELVDQWKSDHPPRPRLLREYENTVERARGFVQEHRIATIPAGERLSVQETPPFQRALCPFAAYIMAGPFEARQDGVFWMTPPGEGADPEGDAAILREHLRPGIPLTAVHEGYPGHHLQLTQANTNASRVRRQFMTPVLVEGWAFYCEEMMAEEGFYDDPRTSVLHLRNQLWRACRIVIDVGLQTRGMSQKEAATMLCDVAGLEPSSARGEVLRYARSATQPMSYAVGKQAILDLREDYRRLQGASFRLQEFHDRFLSFGSIPVALIRELVLGEEASSHAEASRPC